MPRVRRSDPASPGWSLKRRGKGFELFDARGRKLTGEAAHDRVRSLVIPPAWSDVWICPSPTGHIQATGVDGAGRRQYLYHEGWTASRSRAKFRRMSDFAVQLGPLREAVERDLDHSRLHRPTVLAGLVRLLDIGFFRVGSERYASENRTFGLTTLLREHATVRRDGTIVFDYTAKHGKRRVQRATDEDIGELVNRLKRRRSDPDPRLFSSQDEDVWRAIRAADLNAYLQNATGTDITAKDFRTWNGTVLAAALLATVDPPTSKTGRQRATAEMVRHVAGLLGNTPAVARSSYIDPRVVDRWARGETIPLQAGDVAPDPDAWSADERREIELAVVDLLDLGGAATAGAKKAPGND
ncbi:MAG: DNA topoisomerase IB [Solirubrobacteraceae bacterium]|nr:DNA topoisomerase IB [Solirubrobacteraceae bacterium]